MTAEDDAVVGALDQLWSTIREQEPLIPTVAFEIGRRRPSSCTSVNWDQRVPVIRVGLSGSGQAVVAAELLERLLHQAAHALCHQPGKVIATEGRWHGRSFQAAAEALGLRAEPSGQESHVAGTGWSATSLARGTKTRYRAQIGRLDGALRAWQAAEEPQTRRSSRNPLLAVCECSPPRKIRISKQTHSQGPIRCEICGSPFELVGYPAGTLAGSR